MRVAGEARAAPPGCCTAHRPVVVCTLQSHDSGWRKPHKSSHLDAYLALWLRLHWSSRPLCERSTYSPVECYELDAAADIDAMTRICQCARLLVCCRVSMRGARIRRPPQCHLGRCNRPSARRASTMAWRREWWTASGMWRRRWPQRLRSLRASPLVAPRQLEMCHCGVILSPRSQR